MDQAAGGAHHIYRVPVRHDRLRIRVQGRHILEKQRMPRELPIPPDLALTRMEPSDDPRKKYLRVELPPSLKLFDTFRSAIEGKISTEPFADFRDG